MNPATDPTATPRSHYNNWISAIGAVLAIGALFSFALLVWMDLTGEGQNPYLGIFTYIVAPGFLIGGLGIMAFGAWAQRRWLIKHGATMPDRWRLDFSNPRQRRAVVLFGLGGLVFLLLSAFGSYQSYHYAESNEFCGLVCHTAMRPEFETYHRGAHARVACVECHVGSGAAGFVQAKLNGTRQLISFTLDNYQRPIPTPIHNQLTAAETCEKCHWPEKFHGNVELTYDHFLSNRRNDAYTVRMLMHVNQGRPGDAPAGIHWHASKDHSVEYYATDEKRQEIAWMRVTDKKAGTSKVFRTAEFTGNPPAEALRTMDCLDCHNRPAHGFPTANEAIEKALARGELKTTLPSIKRVAAQALLQEQITTAAAAPQLIEAFLKEKFKDHADLPGTIAAVQQIHGEIIFPERKADWRVYPNNIGHKDWAGCFRCHGGSHKDAQGQGLRANDCNSCHTILAQGKGAELATLTATGLEFKHPSGAYDEELKCYDCHNGAVQ